MSVKISPVKRTTIFCKNIDKSLSLYRDILGFSIIEDKVVSGTSIAKMVGLEDCSMHICHLCSENSSDGLIGLYEITADDIPEIQKPESGRLHIGQVAVVVNTDTPDKLYDNLLNAGYLFLTHPTKYTKKEDSDYMKAGVYTEMIFYDPDGVLVSVLGYNKL